MILYIIACILFIPLSIINFIVVLYHFGFNKKTINSFLNESAKDIDIFGNRNFRTLWNKTLIKSYGYKFGEKDKTISYVLGINQKYNTLSFTGKVLVFILNIIDKNHCKKAILTN